MGKKWKRLLVQRRRQQAASVPAPVVSNSEMIERMEQAASAPEPEIVEEAIAPEPEIVEEEPVVEAPKPKRRRSTRRKKTASED